MEILILGALIIAVALGYKSGKSSKEWEITLLQNDNVKLSGEVQKLEREIQRSHIRSIEENFPENMSD